MLDSFTQAGELQPHLGKIFIHLVIAKDNELASPGHSQLRDGVTQALSVQQLEVALLKLQHFSQVCAQCSVAIDKGRRHEEAPLDFDRGFES